MKKIQILLIAVIALAIVMLPKGAAKAATAITTCEQLQDMSLNLAEDYVLGNDIDCSATSGWNAGAGFDPVGDGTNEFTGTLNGQGYKIISLYINRPGEQSVGLFGDTTDITVSNLYLTSVSITGNTYTGGLIGAADNSIQINSVHVTGTITGNVGVGGLIGALYSSAGGEISNVLQSSNSATVNGANYTGGLIGDSGSGANTFLISQSFNSGNITSSSGVAGGIMGYSQYADNGTTLLNSYNSGNITGAGGVGGLFGYAENTTVINSYSSGLITGTATDTVGALVGYWGGLNMTNTFWNSQTSGQTAPCGADYACPEKANSITSAQMRTQTTFTSATWDFSSVWSICESLNNGFPYLQWQGYNCPASVPGLPNTGSTIMNINYSNTWAIENLLKF